MRRTVVGLSGLLVGALALAGCGTDTDTSGGGDSKDPVAVVTTTQLGSIVNDITACNDATAVTVMGPGDDPHEFSPSSQQISQMAKSKLVIVNGLGLEGNLEKAIESARTEGATVFEVAPQLDPIPFGGHDHDHGDDDHDHGDEEDGHDHEGEGDDHADHDHEGEGDDHADHDHEGEGDDHADHDHEGEGDDHADHDHEGE
ncbi:metal ABC transporter solute-binding protein, Zn/Mn family, partial [Enemella sp. A6]|uniref:metal ABC transporter substrate-binding protein n=1 Tax=Enemella sp. A6 TaxID=3440152 RepID=UPI003EBA7FC1